MRDQALSAIRVDEEMVPASEVKQLRTRIRELERLLEKKTFIRGRRGILILVAG